jgi:hypothetical protein
MQDWREWSERTAGPRLLALQADAELRRRHPGEEIEALTSAEPEPVAEELPPRDQQVVSVPGAVRRRVRSGQHAVTADPRNYVSYLRNLVVPVNPALPGPVPAALVEFGLAEVADRKGVYSQAHLTRLPTVVLPRGSAEVGSRPYGPRFRRNGALSGMTEHLAATVRAVAGHSGPGWLDAADAGEPAGWP